jgi:hypothetical protein
MSDNIKTNKNEAIDNASKADVNDRRAFLKWGGAGLAAFALAGAGTLTTFANPLAKDKEAQLETINLGTGDIGIMNFAYLLEQLEADFYTRVVANNFYAGATVEERQILTDLRDHEIIHREFFKATLAANAIPQLMFDFSKVDFNSRDSVLTNSQNMEDTGVSAYNGAGQAIVDPNILALAGKIVSVEGRHAAAIRDLRIPRNGYFAPHSEDFALDPLSVLAIASAFLPPTVIINAAGLPRIIVV